MCTRLPDVIVLHFCSRLLKSSILASILILVLVSVTFVGKCHGQQPSDVATATPKFNVSGNVINSVTGEPVRRALVTLFSYPQRTAFTDGEGHFQIEAVAGGNLAIDAQRPGFFSSQELPPHVQTMVEIGPNTDSVSLKLIPESVIFGQLTNSAGEPIENVPVRLTCLNLREGRKRWDQRGYANTDEDGRFRFPRLQPGTYYVSAGPSAERHENVFGETAPPKTGYPNTYYAGVPDFASASPIRVTAGQQVQADFTLGRGPLRTVSGMISGYLPDQAVSVLLTNQAGDAMSLSTQFRADTGRFELQAPAGTYVLKAYSQSPPNQQLRAEAIIHVNTNVTDLHLALRPAISVPIHVRLDQRAPSNQYGERTSSPRTIRTDDLPPLNVHLISNQPGASDSYSTVDGPAGHRSLVLRSVDPGQYSVELMPQGPWYVESASCGASDLLSEDLTLTQGDGCSMEVALGNDAADLRGTVKDAAPNVPVTVVVVAMRGVRIAPRTVSFTPQAANGSPVEFSLSGIAPGEYLVFAFDHIDNVEYANPDALRPYLSGASHVTLTANQTAKIELDLIHTGAGQ